MPSWTRNAEMSRRDDAGLEFSCLTYRRGHQPDPLVQARHHLVTGSVSGLARQRACRQARDDCGCFALSAGSVVCHHMGFGSLLQTTSSGRH